MVLSDLMVGDTAVIKKVECSDCYKKRLLILGLTDGAKVTLIRKSPFNDPIEIRIRGFCLAVRKTLASKINVEKIE